MHGTHLAPDHAVPTPDGYAWLTVFAFRSRFGFKPASSVPGGAIGDAMFCTLLCCRREQGYPEQNEDVAATRSRANALMRAAKTTRSNPAKAVLMGKTKTRAPMMATQTVQPNRRVRLFAMEQAGQIEEETEGQSPSSSSPDAAIAFTQEDVETSNRFIVEAFEKLAARLEGEAAKYPKSGTGFLTAYKVRYFAAQAADDGSNDPKDGWERKLLLWRRGRLAWWKDKSSFSKKDNPQGSLALMSIKRAVWDEDQPTSVIVRHMEDQEKLELVIKFSAEDIAKEWSGALSQILKLLRRTTLDV